MLHKQALLSVATCIALALDAVTVGACWMQHQVSQQGAERRHQIIDQLSSLALTVQRIESAIRGYVSTGNDAFLQNYYSSSARTQSLLESIPALLKGHETELEPMVGLKNLIAEKLEWEQGLIASYRQLGPAKTNSLLTTLRGVGIMNKINQELNDIRARQRYILKAEEDQARKDEILLLGAIAILSLIACGGIFQAVRLERLSFNLQQQRVIAYERLDELNRALNQQVYALMQSQQQAKQALMVRSDFLAKVSHELRTPLSGVIGATELVLGMPLPEEQRYLISVAKKSGEDLLALVNDILDFQRLEVSEFNLSLSTFELRAWLSSALEPLVAKARQRGLSFHLYVSAEVPAQVVADPMRIQQILVNLVGNAVKFTERGHICVNLSVEQPQAGQTCLHFAVEDTGIGFPPEKLATIFDAFAQADSSVTRKTGGVGLGLSISKQLIELMKGKIEASNRPDGGARISFVIPLQTRTQPSGAGQQRVTGASGTGSPAKVLVVDDSATIRTVTAAQLKRLGCEVTVAESGDKAIEIGARDKFDLIIMDVQMPGTDGLTATRTIRAMAESACRDVPIVALTAHAMAEDRERCLAAGMNDYIAKPATLQTLQLAVSNWARDKERSQETAVLSFNPNGARGI